MRVVSREPEANLIELLQLVEETPQGWQVIVFHFSKLLEHYRSEYQLKIATNLMNDLLGDRDGAIYLCEDATIYVMVRSFPRALTEKMIFQLRYLFMDDPLSYNADGEEDPAFSTVFDLETQWLECMNLCKRRLIARVRQAQGISPVIAEVAKDEAAPTVVIESPAAASMTEFTAASLAIIERDLQHADVTPAIRRQPICAVLPGTNARAVFDEIYININHLREQMEITVDLLSNRWLFKYLTKILDVGMLDSIQKQPARYLASPVSLNLNVATLLSSRFLEFDAAIRPSAKASIIVELQIADVFADMAGFFLAKDTIHSLGYRICLDGVSEHSFLQIDRQRLGVDLVKLLWNSDSETDLEANPNMKLVEAIRHCGNNRVILTRCDNQHAVEYGKALGISLFQGRYLDGLLNPKSSVMN